MERFLPLGRNLFAISLIAFGALQWALGDFLVGRAPAWPEDVAGRVIWAWLTGAVFMGAGIAILFERQARSASLLVALLVLVWALLRHVPVVAAAPLWGGQWTSMGKALMLTGGALAVAGSSPAICWPNALSSSDGLNAREAFFVTARWCLGLFMMLCGIQHFIYEEFVASLVPDWIPGPYFWTYFTGVALIAGGVGLLVRQTARLAAALSGVMVFIWVFVLHVPLALSKTGEWISVFEALAVSGIAFLIAGRHSRHSTVRC